MREEIINVICKCLERDPSRDEMLLLASISDLDEVLALLHFALKVKMLFYGKIITYSRKIFVPLTRMCRNKCAYCGFRINMEKPYMSLDKAMELVKAGEKAKAKEVLVSTGEKPEDAYREARRHLASLGYSSTVEYVREFEDRILRETQSMLPHTNIGVLSKEEMLELKPFNASMGLMLESISERLMEHGGPHEFSPYKHPKIRLKMIREAGELKIPFTTGILIGIGESWEERIDSLMEIKRIHEDYGHIQEVIIQNFMPEPGTPMNRCSPPPLIDVLKTIAIARILFKDTTSVQAPPNLNPKSYPTYTLAGINDWGGISPLTPDYVNPAYPWPKIWEVKKLTELMGFELKERLPIYPKFIFCGWLPEALKGRVEKLINDHGLVREEGVSRPWPQ